MSKRKRRVRVGVSFASVDRGWSASSLKITDSIRNTIVVLDIPSPGTLEHLRQQLDAIEKYWRDCLESCTRK